MTDIDPRKADAAYTSFPSFKEWSKGTELGTTRWDQYTASLLEEKKGVAPDVLQQAESIVRRAAAIETGAIPLVGRGKGEGLG